jgi:hypothetical protein
LHPLGASRWTDIQQQRIILKMSFILSRQNITLVTIISLTLCGCGFFHKDDSEGLFGHSQTEEEAEKNGSAVVNYIPNKYSFALLDGTTLIIDTAWTEESFTYHNGKRVIDPSYGYHLSIPFKKKIPTSFTFNFSLADKTNEEFTNGIGDNLCQLCPTTLFDEMKVLLEQKDPDTSKGWTNPIILDTIVFRRLK